MQVNYYALLELLKLVKFFYNAGLFETICGGMKKLDDDDYCELIQLGLENITPIYDRDQISYGDDGNTVFFSSSEIGDEDYDDHWHDLQTFSSPDMREYYRLCRLYEYRHGIQPEDNPYVKAASRHYSHCLQSVRGNFYAAFDSDRYTTKLWIEYCPENYYPEPALIYCIHDTLEFYSEHLNDLRRELMAGPFVFLPQLPAPKGGASHVRNDL